MVNSRAKGKRAELEVANILREHGFENARRGVQYSGINGDADVVGVDGLHIEVKAVEHLDLVGACDQSKRDAKEGETWVVIHKKNRTPWLATMGFHEFIELWEKSHDKG